MRITRARRATSMLEFVIILPLFLLLIVFIVDVARVLMVNNAVTTATYRAARDAAIRGGTDVYCGAERCYQRTFDQALSEVPGGSAATVDPAGPRVVSGARCTSGSVTLADSVVTLETTYSLSLLTPGLATLLGTGSGGWEGISVSAVARCEVDFTPGAP
jgi:Flp pilus assembly protein TadG